MGPGERRIVLDHVSEEIVHLFRYECDRQGIPDTMAFEEAVIAWIVSLYELRSLGRILEVGDPGDDDVVDRLTFHDHTDIPGSDL